jgi:hypothetical protein
LLPCSPREHPLHKQQRKWFGNYCMEKSVATYLRAIVSLAQRVVEPRMHGGDGGLDAVVNQGLSQLFTVLP